MEGNSFSYHRYIKHVDVTALVEPVPFWEDVARPDTYPEHKCYLCQSRNTNGKFARLLNREHVCIKCLLMVQSIRYPEKYQQLYETYLIKTEAHRIAREEYLKTCEDIHSKWSNSLWEHRASDPVCNKRRSANSAQVFFSRLATYMVVMTFFAVLFIKSFAAEILVIGGCGAAVFGVLAWFSFLVWKQFDSLVTRNETNWVAKNPEPEDANHAVSKWDEKNTKIRLPELKEFHDPEVVLSDRDKLVLRIYDYWPGYPPFWDYLKGVIKSRDGHHCQVSGCPNRSCLHIHHRMPMAEGGSHRPENLVTLCEFHHGLQPELGHEGIWGRVQTQYYSMVRAHLRKGSPVKAHVRRKELADENGLCRIIEYYKLTCVDCGSREIRVEVNASHQELLVHCIGCRSSWLFQRKLLEESGPQIAELLQVGGNEGTESIDWSLLSTIRKPQYVIGKKPARSTGSKPTMAPTHQIKKSSTCPMCGGKLKKIKGRYGAFWGCVRYPGCRYTRNAE